MQTQKITLDFCQNDYKTVTVKQYDKDSRNLIITCTDNGAFYKLDSSTLRCNVKMNTPDDRAIYDTATINKDGTVLVTFSESMVYASGTGKLEIQFLDSSTQKSISTMILTVIIIGSVYSDDKIIASDEFNALTDALLRVENDVNDANEAIERINELEESITTAEASRVVAEESRVLAESKRVTAENTRVSNENTRKTNETARQTAESKRQTDTATAIANAEEATDRANEIAENCKDLMLGSGISITTTETALERSKDGLIRIESIGGVCEQKTYQGYNLLDMSNAKGGTNAEITVTMNPDGSYSYVGTATNTEINVWLIGSWIGTPTLFTIPAGKYFMQGVNLYNDGKPVFTGGREGSIIVLSEDTPVTGVRAVGAVAGTTYNETHYPIIARSEGRVYQWELYTGGIPSPNPSYPQEIKHSVVSEIKTRGKNLLNVDLIDGTKAGITYKLNEDKSVTVSGTRTGGSNYRVGSVYLKAGNYTYGVAKGSFENMHNVFIKPNGELSSSSKNPLVFTVTEENEGVYEFCLKGTTNDVACSGTGFLQVEEGNELTEYEPYKESSVTLSNPIDLYGIGDVQDVIAQKDGVFGVEQKYGTTDLTGTTWVKNTEYQYYTSLDDSKYKRNNRTTVMCDRLISGGGATNGIQINAYGKIRANIVTEEDTINAVADAMNGAIVVAELIEYNFVPLPTVDQIALNNLKSFDGMTYISTDSEVEPIITTEYGTSKTSAHAIEALNKVDNVEVEISEIKPIIEELQIPDITSTTETTMQNSNSGRLLVDEIGGVCEQFTTTGKQLLNPSNLFNGSPKIEDNGYTISYTGKSAWAQSGFIERNIEVGQTWYASVDSLSNTQKGKGNLAFQQRDADKKVLSTVYITESKQSVDFTIVNNAVEFTVLTIANSSSTALESDNTVTVKGLMLSLSEGNAWEPYTGGLPSPNPNYPQEIKKSVVSGIKTHGKNMFQHILTSQSTAGLNVKASKELITISGTNSAAITLSVYNETIKNTKGLFVKAPKTRSGINYIARVHRGDSISYLHVLENGLYIPEGGDIDRLYLQQNNVNTTINLELEPQIIEGNEDSNFEPYTESTIALSQPVELYGKNGVQDVITPKKIKGRFEKVVLDGTENWTLASIGVFYTRTKSLNVKARGIALCDQYTYSASGNPTEGYFDTAFEQLRFYPSNEQTVEEWKNRVASNPITVVYEMLEKTTEELPIADQIALNSLATYDGITYLEFDSEIEPTFEGEYGTSKVGGYTLEGMLAGLNGELMSKDYANRLSALETTLVNNI